MSDNLWMSHVDAEIESLRKTVIELSEELGRLRAAAMPLPGTSDTPPLLSAPEDAT